MNAVPKPNPGPTSFADRQEAIRRRAEEIYIRNGSVPGRDLENWARAEKEILRESAGVSPGKTAIIIKIDGIEYVGEYDLATADGYQPGEFGPGAAVSVRFHGNKMLVKRPSGKVLETTIVRKSS